MKKNTKASSNTKIMVIMIMKVSLQLMEQKRWLEHELEEIKLKIQNDKSHPLPDMLLDWDSLRW